MAQFNGSFYLIYDIFFLTRYTFMLFHLSHLPTLNICQHIYVQSKRLEREHIARHNKRKFFHDCLMFLLCLAFKKARKTNLLSFL